MSNVDMWEGSVHPDGFHPVDRPKFSDAIHDARWALDQWTANNLGERTFLQAMNHLIDMAEEANRELEENR